MHNWKAIFITGNRFMALSIVGRLHHGCVQCAGMRMMHLAKNFLHANRPDEDDSSQDRYVHINIIQRTVRMQT